MKHQEAKGVTYRMWDTRRRELWPEATHYKLQSFCYGSVASRTGSSNVADWRINYIKDREESEMMTNVKDITTETVRMWLLFNRYHPQEVREPELVTVIIKAITEHRPTPIGIQKVQTALNVIEKEFEEYTSAEVLVSTLKRYRVALTFDLKVHNLEAQVNMDGLLDELLQEYMDRQLEVTKGDIWERLVGFVVTAGG